MLAYAQTADTACRADAERYCGGRSEARGCLLDHQQEIPDVCYDALKQSMENHRGFAVCKKNAVRYCRGVQPGGGRILQCLVDHRNDISDTCYDQLAKKKRSAAAH